MLSMAIEISCLTSYLMALVILTLSANTSTIFSVKIAHDYDRDIMEWVQVKCKYINESPYTTPSDDNCNICRMGHHSKRFAVKMCMTLTVIFKMGQD